MSLLINAFMSGVSSAQTTRSLSGTLTLDVGPSELDRNIKITVRNHSLVVLPPFFTIIRPITSSQSTQVLLTAGGSSVDFSINNIITNPVNYTIAIECIGCSGDIPDQFYNPTGNRFSLLDTSYIDPDNLSEVFNLTAITSASISGEIMLDRVSTRDLEFEATVFNSENPERIFKVFSPFVLRSGASAITYRLSGLNRAIGSNKYGIQLQCINCVGMSRRPQLFPASLSPNENHSAINFLVTDEPVLPIAPIISLLLE